LGEFSGAWSPTANELLLGKCAAQPGFFKAEAPEFVPTALQPLQDITCPYQLNAIWKSDGQQVVFQAGLLDDILLGRNGDLWIIDRDGRHARRIQEMSPYVWLRGWMDARTLGYGVHYKAGHEAAVILNTETGEVLASHGLVSSVGKPNSNYLPSDNGVLTLLSIVPAALPTLAAEAPGVYAPHPDEFANFVSWFPGTNKALVLTAPDGHFQLEAWDFDNNSRTVVAPGSADGLLAPNGRILAYLTLPPHLQVLDIETGQVTMTLPAAVTACHSCGDPTYFTRMIAAFSPDSRYLAFLTEGEPQLNSEGQPTGNSRGLEIYVLVIDLVTHQVVYYALGDPEALAWGPIQETKLLWSPTSQHLIYRADSSELVVFAIAEGSGLQLKQGGGLYLGNPQWSFDGQYLSMELRERCCVPSQVVSFRTFILQLP